MSNLERYPKYKDSGIEWIGEIPEGWIVNKIQYILYEKKKTYNIELNCGSISYGKVVYKDDEKIPHSTKRAYQVVKAGDFLINPLNLNYDLKSLRIALSDLNVVVSSGYIVLDIRKDINKKYLNYLLHRFDVAFMKTLGAGVRQTLNYNDIAKCELIEPPIDEQTKIANYLDHKTAQIDKAISLKEQMIERLKERRQILINDAVTKGLDKTVKMKDSGVEWIGEVPEHWEITKLGLCLTPVSIKNRADLPLLSVVREKGVILRDVENKEANHNFIPDDLSNYKVVEKGQFAMNKMKAWQGSYGVSQYTGIVSPAYYVFKLRNIEPDFFHIAIRSKSTYVPFFIQASDGVRIGQWDLSKTRMKEIPFYVPPKNEQKEIVEYIKESNYKIDEAIKLQQQQIEKLKEYKATIIDSVVTGKIKIP